MSGQRVLVVGDVMSDVIVLPEGPLVRGSDRRATIRTHPGGSGANQAVWLAASGVPVSLFARVGADELRTYEAYFRGLNVVPVLEADREVQTGALVTIVDTEGERSFLTDRGANLGLGADGVPDELLDEVGLLLVSGYTLFTEGPRRAVLALMERARQAGLPIAIDPASAGFLAEVGVANFLDWTAGASLIFANRDEAAILTGLANPDAQLTQLGHRFGAVVLKLGGRGGALLQDGRRISLPAPEGSVVDTSGAGDAFAAGYLAAWLAGGDAETCLGRAVAMGSLAVAAIGAQPSPDVFDRLSRQDSPHGQAANG